MKLITWNVNGLRAVERKGELETLLSNYDPDILLIQETKSRAEQVQALDLTYPEYTKYYVSATKAGYSGVAAWVKKSLFHPELDSGSFVQTKTQFSAPKLGIFDDEGRIVEVKFSITHSQPPTANPPRYAIIGCYFPNGGKSDEAWIGKLKFYEQFLTYTNQLRTEGYTVIWGGDVNCAHNEIDLARPKDNAGEIGFHPLERAWLDSVIQNNWLDIWRDTYPKTPDVYSWWHLITRSRARNVGWRIDYWFGDKNLRPNIKNIRYLTEQMGSDHCPVLLELLQT